MMMLRSPSVRRNNNNVVYKEEALMNMMSDRDIMAMMMMMHGNNNSCGDDVGGGSSSSGRDNYRTQRAPKHRGFASQDYPPDKHRDRSNRIEHDGAFQFECTGGEDFDQEDAVKAELRRIAREQMVEMERQ